MNTPVTFSDSDPADTPATIKHFLWDFGDGATADTGGTSSAAHSYSAVGVYTVTLRTVDTAGNTSGPSTQQISVTGAKPNAAFNPTQATVLAGSSIAFDGTQSSDPNPGGRISGYSWNFGDGSRSSTAQPTHTYGTPGTYNVTLTATDNYGGSSSVTHQIKVIAPPPVQTLVESIIPAPILVKFGPPSMLGRTIVDLHQRLFCPGTGPVCRTTISERKGGVSGHRVAARAAANRTVLITRANGNAELAFHLASAQQKTLSATHHLSVTLIIVSVRGAEKVTTVLRFKLARQH